jgi:gluconolactonase
MSCDIILDHLDFPEGPLFLSDGSLWCVELKGGNLIRVDGEQAQRFPSGGKPNGLCKDDDDRIYICDSGHNAILRFDPRDCRFDTICSQVDGAPLFAPNDLCFDAYGNLLFTNPGDSRVDPTGYVCRLSPDGECSKIIEGWNFPNGLGFDASGRLIVAETYKQHLRIGRWDGSTWAEEGEFAHVGGAPGPDGFCLLPDGRIACAVFGAGRIALLDPNGRESGSIALPGLRPTNCCVSPQGALIVTEAEKGLLLRVTL